MKILHGTEMHAAKPRPISERGQTHSRNHQTRPKPVLPSEQVFCSRLREERLRARVPVRKSSERVLFADSITVVSVDSDGR